MKLVAFLDQAMCGIKEERRVYFDDPFIKDFMNKYAINAIKSKYPMTARYDKK